MKNNILEYNVDSDGIALIAIDMKDSPTNLFSLDFVGQYVQTAKKAIADPNVKGVIVTSNRKDFWT